MNLNHLAIFRAVAEAGSVTGGAERLMISQPAVSKQLKQFERSLGTVLFDRVPTGLRLTEAGEVLLAHARRLFAVEVEAAQALGDLSGLRRGRLSVGASMTVGVYLLPELLARYRQLHPAVELSVEIGNTATIQAKLLTSELDVALTEGFAEAPALAARVFRTDTLVPILPAGHRLLQEKRITGAMLMKEPLLLREEGSGTRAIVEQALRKRGWPMKGLLSLGNTEAIKRGVAAGLGWAIVSALAIEGELAAGTLVRVPVKELVIPRPLHHLELKGRHAGPALVAFRELLLER